MSQEKKELWVDPIVAEVRATREDYAKRFNYNLEAIAADIKGQQAQWESMGFKFASLAPKRLSKRTRTRN